MTASIALMMDKHQVTCWRSLEAWVDKTLEECCRENFQFAFLGKFSKNQSFCLLKYSCRNNLTQLFGSSLLHFSFPECMGDIASANGRSLNPCALQSTFEPILKWYVIYPSGQDPVCGQDCTLGPDCLGLSIYEEELYDSYQECCQVHLFWVKNSRCHQGLLTEENSSGQGAAFSGKWYVIYSSGETNPVCGQDCTLGPDCIGSAKYEEELYDSYDDCCEYNLWWVKGSRCYDGK